MSVGAVVLAAGEGSRIGFKPKCLLRLEGKPLIRRQVESLLEAGVAEIAVVLGHYAGLITEAVSELPIKLCYQFEDQHSQPQSVRLGVGALSPHVETILVSPADLPLLVSSDYCAVIAAFAKRSSHMRFLGPLVGGVPGNPVVFDGFIRESIEGGAGEFGSGRWRRSGNEMICHWETDNLHYVTDVDTEEDRQRLATEFGVHLEWPPDL